MSINKEKVRTKVIELLPYRFHISIGVTAFGLWLQFILLPLWQLYFIPAVIGGLIVGDKALRGFWTGFIGMWVALLVYMNITLFTAIEAVDTLVGAAVGISGLGFFVHILILLIWALFSGIGGTVGVYIYPFVPFYEKLNKQTAP